MLRIKPRHAHADAAARFVAGLGIDELLVMRVVHPKRDERCLLALSTAVNEDLHHIAAIQHELAERIRLLRVALLDPSVVLRDWQHLTRPHRHHAKSRLQEMGIHQPRDLIHRGFEHFLAERFAGLVERADAGGDVRRVVAVENAKGCLARSICCDERRGGKCVEEVAAVHGSDAFQPIFNCVASC
jgi:hypothetical protein